MDVERSEADHPAAERPLYQVSPRHEPEPTNTIRHALHPVACWRVPGSAFGGRTSLPGPTFADAARAFARVQQRCDGYLLSLFGHAGDRGKPDAEHALASRRARAVFGLLTRDPAVWEDLFATPAGDDRWGLEAVQAILGALRDPQTREAYYGGPCDGRLDPPTERAVEAFQRDVGEPSTGRPVASTRSRLFLAYMDHLASDGAKPIRHERSRFLDRGQDDGGKAAVQGCSAFNPLVVPPQDDATPRAARSNDRVLGYFFPAVPHIEPTDWPCPRWNDGPSACRGSFWPDGDARRAAGRELRLFRHDRKTMSCRFYDRFAQRSPCEGITRPLRVYWTRFPGEDDERGELVVEGSDGEALLRRPLHDADERTGNLIAFDLDVDWLPGLETVVLRFGDRRRVLIPRTSLRNLRDELERKREHEAIQSAFRTEDAGST